MTVKQFIGQYIANPHGTRKHGNVSQRNGTLYSYAQPICAVRDGKFHVHTGKWSVTTSRQQTWLRAELAYRGYEPVMVDHI